MALKVTAALRNYLLESGSLKDALSNCVLKFYSGAQPATAETAPPGTLLCVFSLASGAITREVLSLGSVALTGGGSGSMNTLTVNGIEIMGAPVNFNTSLVQTATDICTRINNNPSNKLFNASNGGGALATIAITAEPGQGALPNGWVVVSTPTTITKTDANMAGGVSSVNTLRWGDSVGGILPKDPTQVWTGVALVTATVGWFRIESGVADALGTDVSESVMRMDGAVGVSGAELNGVTTITAGVTQTIQSLTITLPTD